MIRAAERVISMWTVVYMAKNKEIAEKLLAELEKNGMLVKIRPITKGAQNAEGSYEVLVPESEVELAHSVIIDTGF